METPKKRSKFSHRHPETLIPCVHLVSAHCVHQSYETQQPQQKVQSHTTGFKAQSNSLNELVVVSYREKKHRGDEIETLEFFLNKGVEILCLFYFKYSKRNSGE